MYKFTVPYGIEYEVGDIITTDEWIKIILCSDTQTNTWLDINGIVVLDTDYDMFDKNLSKNNSAVVIKLQLHFEQQEEFIKRKQKEFMTKRKNRVLV